MPKEDGRLTPAEPKEYADIKGKHFRCVKCGEHGVFTSSEFAETKKCGKCGGEMEELLGGKASTGRLD